MIEILKNKKAWFLYNIEQTYTTGIKLLGSEIKSIRNKDIGLNDSYCYIVGNKIYIKNFYIKEYKFASHNNHLPLREKELLLKQSELNKIINELKNVGKTLIPLKVFINNRGLCKIDIAICKGKKTHDKREYLKKKEAEREIQDNK